MNKSGHGAVLSRVGTAPPAPAALVLVLHGGSTDSFTMTRGRDLAVLRLWPIARVIARVVPSVAVHRLRFSVRGWNANGAAVVRDARWAIQILRERFPSVPIVLVGHSMGARTALHVGGDADIAGLVLLAPWAPSDDPAEQLAGRTVVVVQGARDRMVPEPTTRPWLARARAAGARVSSTLLPFGGHTMLRRFWVWHRLAAQGVLTVITESAAAPAGWAGWSADRMGTAVRVDTADRVGTAGRVGTADGVGRPFRPDRRPDRAS